MSDETAELQGEIGITLYRVVQECLTNITRHAGAGKVEIAVSRLRDGQGEGGDRLELLVHDDGRGFDEKAGSGGFGLLGIRERIRALGGTCIIDGSGGRGTRVMAQLPFSTSAGDAA